MNTDRIVDLLAQKSREEIRVYENDSLGSLGEFLVQPDIAAYLRNCLPGEVVGASGVRVLPLAAIEMEMSEGAAPGSFIRPFGYLVVATSIGGNAICFHSPSGRVFWADHTSFNSDSINYKDRTTGQYKYLYDYNPENVQRALLPLSDSIENFLADLLTDQLEARLDALDS